VNGKLGGDIWFALAENGAHRLPSASHFFLPHHGMASTRANRASGQRFVGAAVRNLARFSRLKKELKQGE
jgi:hypothetical protein